MKALKSQVGGSHYKDMAFQPIVLITALECSFIQGCIIKYISRYKNKNGAQDIEKCIHYAQLAIALRDKKECNAKVSISVYVLKNRLTAYQYRIINQAVHNEYARVIQTCKELLRLEYNPQDYIIDD